MDTNNALGTDQDDQLSNASGILKWEMATQTDYVKILNPYEQEPLPQKKQSPPTVHDLVEDLHAK